MENGIKVAGFILRTAAWGLFFACFGVLALVGIGPHSGRYHTLSVLSGSMRPGIPVGAMVVVTPESPRDIHVGQIITYMVPVAPHEVISHRVIKVVTGAGSEHPVIQTKGDANNAPDAWLARIESPKVWRVRYAVPAAGRLIAQLRSPAIHAGAVRVMPAVLAALWLVSIWRHKPDDPAAATADGAVASA